MRSPLGNRLRNAAYVAFLFFYIFAAAAYGLTRDAPLRAFEWGMAGTFVLWLLAHAVLRRWPATGLLPWLLSGAVLIYGWFVTGMAVIDDAMTDDRLPGWDDWFPDDLLVYWSSYDAGLSLAAMTRTSALLFAMLIAIDIWRDARWARALILTMILSAFAMVIFFFLQRAFGPPFLLSDIFHKTTLTFGTYRYWGNAAAYLNLLWPITMSVAIFAAIRKSYLWPLWMIPAATIFAANFMNVSKAGNMLAIIGIVTLGALLLPKALLELKRGRTRLRKSHILGALIPILLITIALPFAIPWKRWEFLADNASNEAKGGRSHAYATFLSILPDSGWVGYGPGTFKLTYLHYVKDDPELSHVPYWVAHEDYIQTAIEWGYLGTALWALILVPGGVSVLARSLRKPESAPGETSDYRITLLDHLQAFLAVIPSSREPFFATGALVAIILTALHSLVDFPMQIASLQLYFLILIALGWSYLARGKSKSPGLDQG